MSNAVYKPRARFGEYAITFHPNYSVYGLSKLILIIHQGNYPFKTSAHMAGSSPKRISRPKMAIRLNKITVNAIPK